MNEDRRPKGVYFKNGAYFLVHKNRWHRLGLTIDMALIEKIKGTSEAELLGTENRAALRDYLRSKISSIRSSARERGLEFSLSADAIVAMAESQEWRCAMTRLHFTLEKRPEMRIMPYAPSVDRIEHNRGYVPDNIRIVCAAINIARNNLPDDVFFQITVFAGIELTRLAGQRRTRNFLASADENSEES